MIRLFRCSRPENFQNFRNVLKGSPKFLNGKCVYHFRFSLVSIPTPILMEITCNSVGVVQMVHANPDRNFSLRSLRFDGSNVSDNAINQWFDWLNEEKQSCCTCSTLFSAIFWRRVATDGVKFSYLRFWRARSSKSFSLCPVLHGHHSCQASESALRLFCTTWPTWNNRKRLNLTQSSISLQLPL